MDSGRILTHIFPDVLADAFYDSGVLTELTLIPDGKESLLGNIYVGRVKNIVKNIQAAFVEIEGGILCYLPLEDVKKPLYTKPKKQEVLTEGDELLVQVTREAVKTKAPSVTTNLNLAGRYLVLTTGNHTIGYSSRISASEKAALRTLVESWELPDAGVIVRTNAARAGEKALKEEFDRLRKEYLFLTGPALHRTVFSCVRKSPSPYLSSILGSRQETLLQILTDEESLYDEIRDFLKTEMPEAADCLSLYQDRQLPLKALYRLEKELKDALSTKVWLKSGAYLIIEPTEAMTVIDVNTGKYTGGKSKAETVRKINQEAAREIARQLRLRNLSGIILIDFVDMEKKEDEQELLALMRELLRRDPLKAAAVDMTELGLMELTRKKEKKTLPEQAKECGI